MKIESFKQLDNITFDIQESEIEAQLNLNCEIRKVSRLTEYDFGKYIFRFRSDGCLSEVTTDAAVINFGFTIIKFNELKDFLEENDENSYEKVGFIISPKFGLAFDPEFFPWVTFLTHDGLVSWGDV